MFRAVIRLFTYGFCLLASFAWAEQTPSWRLVINDNLLPEYTLYLAFYPAEAGNWAVEPVLRLKQTLPDYKAFARPISLPAGRYAVRGFIDVDANGELTLNEQGRPAEPYTNSQAEGQRPSPLFERSIITLNDEQPQLQLQLRYPPGSRP